MAGFVVRRRGQAAVRLPLPPVRLPLQPGAMTRRALFRVNCPTLRDQCGVFRIGEGWAGRAGLPQEYGGAQGNRTDKDYNYREIPHRPLPVANFTYFFDPLEGQGKIVTHPYPKTH